MDLKNITLKEAVEEHRKMWRWISENIKKPGFINNEDSVDLRHVKTLKKRYFEEIIEEYDDEIARRGFFCFCCIFRNRNYMWPYMCSMQCPLKWNTFNLDNVPCELSNSPYHAFSDILHSIHIKTGDYREKDLHKLSDLAKEIAELPINFIYR